MYITVSFNTRSKWGMLTLFAVLGAARVTPGSLDHHHSLVDNSGYTLRGQCLRHSLPPHTGRRWYILYL